MPLYHQTLFGLVWSRARTHAQSYQALNLLSEIPADNTGSSLDKKQHFTALFVDLSKRFDTNTLVNEQLFTGFDDSALRLFKSYLSTTVQTIGFRISPQMAEKGVPQGLIKRPLL